MFPGVVQYGDGRDPSASSAPNEDAPPVDSDRVTRTRTTTGSNDATGEQDKPANDERLPAPLQYRDPARYDIVGEHGRGGLGRVFRARDKELGRDVAVKELLTRGSTSELRFFREALITARLEHPGIVPVHEAGRWPDGTPFYAMKLVAGRPLKALIEECKTLEDRLALLPHVIAVADAIAYAHDRKIIHRDLKPSNIIVGDFGETVVIDWGLAKDISGQAQTEDPVEDGPYRTNVSGAGGDGVTVAGSVVGTPAYMSPEQARGEIVDERTDIYAIGAILRDLATAPGAATLSVDRRVDADLAAIIARSLSPHATSRYASAAALGSDLRAQMGALRVTAREYGLAGLLRLWYRRNTRLAAALLTASLLIAALGLWSGWMILGERDQAQAARAKESTARIAAIRQRDAALVAQARSTLDRDPTAAHAIVAEHNNSIEASLILARAEGEKLARFTKDAKAPVSGARVTHDGARVVVATINRTLTSVDIQSGNETPLASDLPEFSPLEWQGNGWWFTSIDGARAELRHSGSGVRYPISAEARVIHSNATSTVVLLATGSLLAIRGNAPPIELSPDIVAVALTEDGKIFACNKSGQLLRGEMAEHHLSSHGTCDASVAYGILVARGTVVVVPTSRSRFTVYRTGTTRSYDIPRDEFLVAAAVSPTGSIGLIASHGATYYLDEVGTLKAGFRSESLPTFVACDSRHRIAWSYRNGEVLILDSETADGWSIKAHSTPPDFLEFADAGNELLTASTTMVRIWSLDELEPAAIVTAPCASFNLAQSPDHPNLLASDCSSGEVWLFDLNTKSARLLHRHHELSFSVAWIGHDVCSGGWDGAIICTDTRNFETRLIAQHDSPSRWLTSADGKLAYVTGDGAVWVYEPSAESNGPGSHRIATLSAEPYRLAWQGSTLVVTTRSGGITFFDDVDRPAHEYALHSDVTSVEAANGGSSLSFGLDGVVQMWQDGSPTLRWLFDGSVRDLRPLGAFDFAATISRTRLHVRHGEEQITVDLGSEIEGIATTASSVVAGLHSGDLVVVDRKLSGIASLPLHDSEIRAIAPLMDGKVAVSTLYGSLYVINPESLRYTTLGKEVTNAEAEAPTQPINCSRALQRLLGQCSRRQTVH